MIILLGKHGQVAQEVIAAAQVRGLELQAYSSQEADFLQPESVRKVLESAPSNSVIINASAYTQVDLAEKETEAAQQINGVTPGVIAETCRDCGHKLIHLSTDYVFSGEKSGPYLTTDTVGPTGVYGATKLEGESRILAAHPASIVLRTAWVFSAHGKNFVKTMLRLGAQKQELSVVADQNGCPTSAESIAGACLELATQITELEPSSVKWGIYHYCGAPATTWHGFAEEIFRQSQLPVRVKAIATAEYPTPAKRPANSVLDCTRLAAEFGISQPCWKEDLSRVIPRLTSHEL